MSDRTAHKEERLNEFPVTERETSGVYNCLGCVFVYHNKRPQLERAVTDRHSQLSVDRGAEGTDSWTADGDRRTQSLVVSQQESVSDR